MLMPKRVKHRKQMRGRMRGNAKGGSTVAFGEYGLKALERGWITNRQIEAARVAMTRKIKRGGKVWINIFPDKPYTKKPAETRMGSGKGNPEGWVAVVKPGRVMFELAGVPEELAREAMRLAGHKLPVRTKFVTREGPRADEGRRGPQPERRRAGGETVDAKQEAFNLRFRHATGELENTARLGDREARRGPAADRGARARHRRRARAEEMMATTRRRKTDETTEGRGRRGRGGPTRPEEPAAEETPRRGGLRGRATRGGGARRRLPPRRPRPPAPAAAAPR